MKYPKLVRDGIPEIIKENGEDPVFSIAEGEEYTERLIEKLFEEAAEFKDARNPEEMADLVEVMNALMLHFGFNPREVDYIRKLKRLRRGGFEKGIVLESVERPRAKVGVGVMVWKDGKVLMGKRKGAHGEGEWAWPGGHFEYMEAFEECARREVMEETGMEIQNIRFLRLCNLKQYAPKHYVDIGLIADWASGEPRIMEPDKIEGWEWFDPINLPSPVFHTIPSYFEALRTGQNYWD